MYDIKNLNIWKTDPAAGGRLSSSEIQTLKAGSSQLDVYTGRTFTDTPLEELSLSVRSFNCLRRSGCRTIGDILSLSGEDEQGLMKIRNLGVRSASEIMEKLAEYQQRLLTEEAASGAVSTVSACPTGLWPNWSDAGSGSCGISTPPP